MTPPVRYSGGRLRYTGRIDRTALAAWCTTSEARSVVEPIVSTVRFALFGKVRAAQRAIWRETGEAARSYEIAARLQQELDGFLSCLSTLAYARDLPCVGIDLHRLIVVPRLFANAAVDRRIDTLLEEHPAFATLDGRQPLRDWFTLQMIASIEAALVDARPSPTRPLAAGPDWIVVSVNERFEWRLPFRGPAWPGHYYLLELTRAPITRGVRKAAAEAIARMESALTALPRSHRAEILKQAELSLEQMRTRAAQSTRVHGHAARA